MTQGERVKIVRKENNLTLEAFGKRLGVTKVAISNIENNNRKLTDQMLISICREFNVNEDWLRNENGEAFVKTTPYEKAYNRFGYIMENSTPSKKAALTMLLELLYRVPDKEWEIIMKQFEEAKKEG